MLCNREKTITMELLVLGGLAALGYYLNDKQNGSRQYAVDSKFTSPKEGKPIMEAYNDELKSITSTAASFPEISEVESLYQTESSKKEEQYTERTNGRTHASSMFVAGRSVNTFSDAYKQNKLDVFTGNSSSLFNKPQKKEATPIFDPKENATMLTSDGRPLVLNNGDQQSRFWVSQSSPFQEPKMQKVTDVPLTYQDIRMKYKPVLASTKEESKIPPPMTGMASVPKGTVEPGIKVVRPNERSESFQSQMYLNAKASIPDGDHEDKFVSACSRDTDDASSGNNSTSYVGQPLASGATNTEGTPPISYDQLTSLRTSLIPNVSNAEVTLMPTVAGDLPPDMRSSYSQSKSQGGNTNVLPILEGSLPTGGPSNASVLAPRKVEGFSDHPEYDVYGATIRVLNNHDSSAQASAVQPRVLGSERKVVGLQPAVPISRQLVCSGDNDSLPKPYSDKLRSNNPDMEANIFPVFASKFGQAGVINASVPANDARRMESCLLPGNRGEFFPVPVSSLSTVDVSDKSRLDIDIMSREHTKFVWTSQASHNNEPKHMLSAPAMKDMKLDTLGNRNSRVLTNVSPDVTITREANVQNEDEHVKTILQVSTRVMNPQPLNKVSGDSADSSRRYDVKSMSWTETGVKLSEARPHTIEGLTTHRKTETESMNSDPHPTRGIHQTREEFTDDQSFSGNLFSKTTRGVHDIDIDITRGHFPSKAFVSEIKNMTTSRAQPYEVLPGRAAHANSFVASLNDNKNLELAPHVQLKQDVLATDPPAVSGINVNTPEKAAAKMTIDAPRTKVQLPSTSGMLLVPMVQNASPSLVPKQTSQVTKVPDSISEQMTCTSRENAFAPVRKPPNSDYVLNNAYVISRPLIEHTPGPQVNIDQFAKLHSSQVSNISTVQDKRKTTRLLNTTPSLGSHAVLKLPSEHVAKPQLTREPKMNPIHVINAIQPFINTDHSKPHPLVS